MEGYDLRSRATQKVATKHLRYGVPSPYLGHAYQTLESVTSWRSNVASQPLDESIIDPYKGWLSVTADRRREEQRAIQNRLKAAGMAGLPDYEVQDFTDIGHPFVKDTYRVNTSLRAERKYMSLSTRPNELSSGGPFWAGGTMISSERWGDSLFPLNSTDDTGAFTSVGRSFLPDRTIPLPSDGELEDYGKRAISILAPGQPAFDMTRAVGELIAGMPSLPGRALFKDRDFSSGGDEWLNMLFGIIPTVADATNFAHVLRKFSTILCQYRRDAGRVVRRSMVFPEIVRSAIFSGSDIQSGFPGWIQCGRGYGFNPVAYGSTATVSTQTVMRDLYNMQSSVYQREMRTVRFAGAFTYYLPTTPGFMGRLGRYVQEMDHMLGLSLDPTTVWELTPWSWLIDWFLDIKQQIRLIEVAYDDNLVINYGYAMEHTYRSAVCKIELPSGSPKSDVHWVSTYLESERKRRIRANPYGFMGLEDTEGWNPFRWSILAALGLSRAR